jgi:hypothetical protein
MSKYALKDSIRKWEAICNDKREIWEATAQCGLCRHYAGNGCPICPLARIGERCMIPESTWGQIFLILDPLEDELYCNGDDWEAKETLSDLDNPELTTLCHKMLETLKGLDKGEG